MTTPHDKPLERRVLSLLFPHLAPRTSHQMSELVRQVVEEVRSDPGGFDVGDVVRYGDGPTALMRLESRNQNRWYGHQCMGGSVGADVMDLRRPTEHDLNTWASHHSDAGHEDNGCTQPGCGGTCGPREQAADEDAEVVDVTPRHELLGPRAAEFLVRRAQQERGEAVKTDPAPSAAVVVMRLKNAALYECAAAVVASLDALLGQGEA